MAASPTKASRGRVCVSRTQIGSAGRPERHYAAFTVAELGEMLPMFIPDKGELNIIHSSAWRFYYGAPPSRSGIKFMARTDGNEADSRAELLVYMIEKNLMTP